MTTHTSRLVDALAANQLLEKAYTNGKAMLDLVGLDAALVHLGMEGSSSKPGSSSEEIEDDAQAT